MPPKKKEEVASVVTALEGESERMIEVRLQGRYEGPRAPHVQLFIPGADEAVKIKLEGSTEAEPRTFDVELYKVTVLVNNAALRGVLTNDIVVKFFITQEAVTTRPITPAQVKAVPGGKKAPAAPAGKDAKGGATAAAETTSTVTEQLEIGAFAFNFVHLLQGSRKFSKLVHHIPGLLGLTLEASADSPLLSEVQVQRLWPFVIDIISLSDMPDTRRAGLEGVAPEKSGDYTKLNANCKGVSVRTVVHPSLPPMSTYPLPHARNIHVNTAKVYFLREIFRTPLELMQHFFGHSFLFEVHDREPLTEGQSSPSVGVVSISLQSAVFNSTSVRFKYSEHVKSKPAPVNSAGSSRPPLLALPDYVAFGTQLSLRCSFLAPLPRLDFQSISTVNESKAGNLTCMMVTMPHTGGEVPMALRAILATLVKYGCVTGPDQDVLDWKRPPSQPALDLPPPPEEKPGGKKPPAKVSGKQLMEVPLEAPQPPSELLEPMPWGQQRLVYKVCCAEAVSGFEVMDQEQRIFFIESVRGTVLKDVHTALLPYIEGGTAKVIMDPTLAYPKRLFSEFPPLVRVPVLSSPVKRDITTASVADSEAVKPAVSAPGKAPSTKAPAKAPPGKAPVASLHVESLQEPPPKTPSTENVQPAQLADPGGVLGRLRRMKIHPTLGSIAVAQTNYIKGNQSKLCINAVEKLLRLRTIGKMQEAFDFRLIPTPEELVALERAFGQTLSTRDVCDRDTFTPFDQPLKESQLSRISGISGPSKISKSTKSTASAVGQTQPSQASSPTQGRTTQTPPLGGVNEGGPLCGSSMQHKVDARNKLFEQHIIRREKRVPHSKYCKALEAQKQHYAATHSIDPYALQEDSDEESEAGYLLGYHNLPSYEAPPPEPMMERDFMHLNISGAGATALRTQREIKVKGVVTTSLESSAYQPAVPEEAKEQLEKKRRGELLWCSGRSKTAAEANQHKMKPSGQRIDDLKEPWVSPYQPPNKPNPARPQDILSLKLNAFLQTYAPAKVADTRSLMKSGKAENVLMSSLFEQYNVGPEEQKKWQNWQPPAALRKVSPDMKVTIHSPPPPRIESVFNGIEYDAECEDEMQRGKGRGLVVPLKVTEPVWKCDAPHSIFKPRGDPSSLANKRSMQFYYASSATHSDVVRRKHEPVPDTEKTGALWGHKSS